MIMKKLYILIAIIAAFSFCLRASAQVLPFVAVEHSPVAMARGGASYTDITNTSYSAFESPAAMSFSHEKMDLSVGYTLWQPQQVKTNIMNAAGMFKLNDKFGLAAGFSFGMLPSYDITSSTGKVTGTFKPSQMELSVGFAWRFHENVSLGANVGYATNKLAESVSYSAVVADVQLMAVFGGLKASLGVSDLGSGVTASSGEKFSLPTSANLAAGYDVAFADKHSVGVDAVAQYYFIGDFAAAVGASYTYNDFVSFRAGYRYGADSVIPSFASVGAGVKLAGIKIDMAYLISSTAMANTLCLSLGYSF